MRKRAFTLIELVVVILIVGILAAIVMPIMRGNSAKWSEGRTMMGSIATAIRTYVAEKEEAPEKGAFEKWEKQLRFKEGDLDGTYFDCNDFTILECSYGPNAPVLKFLIKGENATLIPAWYTLDEKGEWNWDS